MSGAASRSHAQPGAVPAADTPASPARAGLTSALTLTVTAAVAAFLLVMAVVLLAVHPAPISGLETISTLVEQQNTTAKTLLYLLAFFAVLPAALVLVPRVADRLAHDGGPDAPAAAARWLSAALVALLLAVRLSAHLPWGDGLGTLLVALVLWWALAGAMWVRGRRAGRWPALAQAQPRGRASVVVSAGVLVVGVLAVTDLSGLSLLALGVGVIVGMAVLAASARPWPQIGRPWPAAFDAVLIVALALAVPNVIVFTATGAPPNQYFPPGIIQFHQDFLLGPANQLLGGGALLVNVPVSQYGVGFIYLLAGWFHLVPISYGTYGLLDGIATALFYVAGYLLLRLAAVNRLVAGGALGLAVLVFVFHLTYPVGSLPQQGPLRFGFPLVIIVASVARARWPHRAPVGVAVGLLTVAVSAVWSLEAFAYCLFTLAGLAVAQAWLGPAGVRLRTVTRALVAAVAAAVAGHVVLAAVTLIGSGHLPDWGQYLAYVRALVLGGTSAGEISYGFANWSPALALGIGYAASATALVLVLHRARELARTEMPVVLALAGLTAYGVALFSYTENRSSTYLLLYVALPAWLAAVLWLEFLRRREDLALGVKRATLACAGAVAVIMFAAAWPTIGLEFSQSALAHAVPGRGLGGALRRLEHPPPIDPRAVAGVRLLDRYLPGRRAYVLLPDALDLGIEMLMRSHRSNALYLGDPRADGFIDPSEWTGRIGAQLRRVRPGQRILTDAAGLSAIRRLRGRPADAIVDHPDASLNPQLEWILHQLDRRFAVVPVRRDASGLIVAQLRPR